MEDRTLPSYAVFDDYRHYVRIAVLVRWFVLGVWFLLHNTRVLEADSTFWANNGLATGLALLNGYVSWRLWRGLPITMGHALQLSIMDLVFITVGIFTTTGFGNNFVVLYYPALLAMAIVFPSRRLSFGAVTLVAIVYAVLSFTTDPGVNVEHGAEKVLIIRIAVMFAVVAAANLMHRVERARRREAVEAERAQAERNLELQKKAREAEQAAQEERDRIAREIHDGVAQSIHALGLNLETAAELADREKGPLREQLSKLVPLAKKTLLETRQYIFDLKPLLAGESDLKSMAENQVQEFRTIAGTPIELSVAGRPSEVSVAVAAGLYRILQEALANVLKHARASEVKVAMSFEPGSVMLVVEDDGEGIDLDGTTPGYGLQNMRERAEELDGSFEILGSPGKGTKVGVTLPTQGGEA